MRYNTKKAETDATKAGIALMWGNVERHGGCTACGGGVGGQVLVVKTGDLEVRYCDPCAKLLTKMLAKRLYSDYS